MENQTNYDKIEKLKNSKILTSVFG